jgi:hypothetical protein
MAIVLKLGGAGNFSVNGKYCQKGQYDYQLNDGILIVWNIVGNNKNSPIINAPISEVLDGDNSDTPFDENTLTAWIAANFFLTSSGGGGGGGSVSWADITSKPTTFAPSTHAHAWDDITSKPTTFAPAAHNQAASTINSGVFVAARLGGGTATDGFYLKSVGGTPTWAAAPSGGGGSTAWDDITGKPSTFAPSAHTHAWADVTGKPSTFAPAAHNHAASEITSGTLAASRVGAGTTTDGLILKLVLGVPTWSVEASGGGGGGWGLNGNAITSSDFIGTTNNQDLILKQNNQNIFKYSSSQNIAIGTGANSGTGTGAVSIGTNAVALNSGGYSLGMHSTASGSAAYAIGFQVANNSNNSIGLGMMANINHDGGILLNQGTGVAASSDSTNQFKAVFSGGYRFNIADGTIAMEILDNGKVRILNLPSYGSEAAANAAEAPGTLYVVNMSPHLLVTF